MELLVILAGLAILFLVSGLTGTLTLRWTRGSTNVPSTSSASQVTVTADNINEHEVSLTDQQANKAINVDIDASTLQAIFIYSDNAITLKANSSSEPDFTLTIAAGIPFVWKASSGISNPLVDAEGALVDVTTFYASTSDEDGAAGNIVVAQNNP